MPPRIGGPVPVWVQTGGIVATLLMGIPVVVTAVGHHFTGVVSFREVWESPTLRSGGLIDGIQLNDPAKYPHFLQILRDTIPYLFIRSLAGILILVDHVAFEVNQGWMILRPRTEDEGSPLLLRAPEPMHR